MSAEWSAPSDRRALVAIDLGAESCRVSLLRWLESGPETQLVYRFANRAVELNGGLRWRMTHILEELEQGLMRCADIAVEGVRSIGVDGWAVDYVRIDARGFAIAEPFCYRDERTIEAEAELHERLSAERMREITGIQLLRINTVYQMFADEPDSNVVTWLNLPEFVMHSLGGRPVAELTNATHTQMLALDGTWSDEILEAIGSSVSSAPEIALPGTDIGRLKGRLAGLPAFVDTRLVVPCCHDTASAIAAVPDVGHDWAYISSGTWSLVGTLLDAPVNTPQARAANFTNLGGPDGKICFHKNVNGMWILRQCLENWSSRGATMELSALVDASCAFAAKPYVLDVDDPDLLLPGNMPARINAQLLRRGLPPCGEGPSDAAEIASLIFHSLAARYAEVLQSISEITGKRFRRLYIFGGGSQNQFLNRLTEEKTGLRVQTAGTESSTIGNFAVQLSGLEREPYEPTSVWARRLLPARHDIESSDHATVTGV